MFVAAFTSSPPVCALEHLPLEGKAFAGSDNFVDIHKYHPALPSFVTISQNGLLILDILC